MDDKKEENNPPLKPYDDTIWEDWSLYDNMPYVWNHDLSTGNTLSYESGNLIKAYRYKLQDPYELKYK